MLHCGLRFLVLSVCLVATGGLGTAGQASSRVKTTDVKVGSGHKATPGDLVTVLYEGSLADGTVFDSNFAKDSNTLSFVLGRGDVIKGWDDGVAGMAKGGERKLVIPPSLGYGDKQHGNIPANSTLYFTVRCLDIVKVGEENVFDKVEVKAGKGAVARKGMTVTVDYVGKLLNGKVFDSTYETKKPVSFTLGAGEALNAIDMGVTGMRVGGERILRLPPALAFGSAGNPLRGVPANAVVLYDIVLRKVKKAKR